MRPWVCLLFTAAQAVACVPDDPPNKAVPMPSSRIPPNPFKPPSGFTPVLPHTAASARPGDVGKLPEDPLLTAPFSDHFDRAEVGPDWNTTAPAWHLEGGRLCVEHAKNHPAWLKRRLPTNARIEFDAMSASEDGDLKAEFWGDGRSAADRVTYNDATSYLTIFGGWKNSFHVLARIDEHAPDRPEVRLEEDSTDVRARKVQPNKTYHFRVIRDDGHNVRWSVDDVDILTYADTSPLLGPGHDHFGFNDWDVRACFDNLTVTPLP